MSKQTTSVRRRTSPTLAITDLMDRAVLQALQDRFSEKRRVTTAILDLASDPITYERRHCAFCREIRKTTAGYELCRRCDRKTIAKARKSQGARWRRCDHGGLLDFAAPLVVSGRIRAWFFVGQVRRANKATADENISLNLHRLIRAAQRTGEVHRVDPRRLQRMHGQVRIRDEEEFKKIGQAAREFAHDLSRELTNLDRWGRPREVSSFGAKVARVSDLDELFNLCIRDIPKLLETHDCSVLTVVRAKSGVRATLVLRRTSYGPSRKLEGVLSYQRGQGLTGWVWQYKRPLRLRNIQDKAELRRYSNLQWSQTANDSDKHVEWMGVPLFDRHKEVIGVLRIPRKKRTHRRGGGGFSLEDEILFVSIAQHVARRMEQLQATRRLGEALRASVDCAVQLSRATDTDAIATVTLKACEEIFGTRDRAYFFDLLTVDGKRLDIRRMAGSLSSEKLVGTDFPVRGSLAGVCFRRGRAEIVHEVSRAEARGEFYRTMESLECAMVAPISFGGKHYACVGVCSSRRYEFVQEPDLRILQDLADMTGAAMARLEAKEETEQAFKSFSRRAGHTLLSRIQILEGTIASLPPEAVGSLQSTAEFLKSAASLALRFGSKWDRKNFRTFKLTPIIERLITLYDEPRLSGKVTQGLTMNGDPNLVEQLLVELVTNSFRFVDKRAGKVAINVGRESIRSGRRVPRPAVVIEVRDNGPGVPRGLKKKIFEPYETHDEEHFGLGLSTVMDIAQVHGGFVEERGRHKHGARFRAVFPQ